MLIKKLSPLHSIPALTLPFTSLLFHPKLVVRALTSELCWSNRSKRANSFCSSTGISLTYIYSTTTTSSITDINPNILVMFTFRAHTCMTLLTSINFKLFSYQAVGRVYSRLQPTVNTRTCTSTSQLAL